MMSVASGFNAAVAGTSVRPVLIFLDLDGVVADFEKHAVAHGKSKPDGQLDYPALNLDWWSNIPAYRGAKSFYNALRRRGPVKFLTATPHLTGQDSYSGKAAWVMKFCGRGPRSLLDLIISPRADKCLLARADRILVDDRPGNIAEWVAAGGIGIHHTGDFADTLRRVDLAIAALAPAPEGKGPGALCH